MKNISVNRNIGYNLRHGKDAQLSRVCTTSFGIEIMAFLENRILQEVPHEIKDYSKIQIFADRLSCVHHHVIK